MDEHGQVGPTKPDYEQDLDLIAKHLTNGRVIYVVFTALGSRWGMLFTPKTAVGSYGAMMRGVGNYPGNDIAGLGYLSDNDFTTLAVVEGRSTGSYTLAVGVFHEPIWLAGKLFGWPEDGADGLAIAAFLNRIELRRGGSDMRDWLAGSERQRYRSMWAGSASPYDLAEIVGEVL